MSSLPTRAARGLFVTATDTGAGKTTLLCRLIPELEKAGLELRIRKPVESGCRLKNGHLVPSDAMALAHAPSKPLPVEQVCAYRLRHACSPARAAQLENVELTVGKLAAVCVADSPPEDCSLLVEGAGGLCSPIARDGLNADLARALGLPLLVVVEDRLGCINHALLTLEAATHRRLDVAAVVVNQAAPPGDADTDNYGELKVLTDAPVFTTPYVGTDESATAEIQTLARYLAGRLKKAAA